MTTSQRNTSARIERRGEKGYIYGLDVSSPIITYSQELDTNNAVYLSAETIYLGNESKTFIEARYYNGGIERDVSTTLKPNPRHDTHLNNMEVLHHYSKLFDSADCIYYTLEAVGHVGNLGNIKSQKIAAQENPMVPLLAETIKRTMEEIRKGNRGLYA